MNPLEHQPQTQDFFQTRRQFLNRLGMGMGTVGLATVLPNLAAAPNPSAALQTAAMANPIRAPKPQLAA